MHGLSLSLCCTTLHCPIVLAPVVHAGSVLLKECELFDGGCHFCEYGYGYEYGCWLVILFMPILFAGLRERRNRE